MSHFVSTSPNEQSLELDSKRGELGRKNECYSTPPIRGNSLIKSTAKVKEKLISTQISTNVEKKAKNWMKKIYFTQNKPLQHKPEI